MFFERLGRGLSGGKMAPAALAFALLPALWGCDPGQQDVSPKTRTQPAPGRTLAVWVESPPHTSYYARCHIRTFKDRTGKDAAGELQGYANVYVIDASGPFHDRIPSPNAQCLVTKVSGGGDVVLHIEKGGDHAVRVTEVMRWARLNVW